MRSGSEPELAPIIRPSDAFALSKIAFQLPSRWMEWITLPPLGIKHLSGFKEEADKSEARFWLSVLQMYGEELEARGRAREEIRESLAAGRQEIGA